MACVQPDQSVSPDAYAAPMTTEPVPQPETVTEAQTDKMMERWKEGDSDTSTSIVRRVSLPSPAAWQHMTSMAHSLAQSALIRARGYHKPEDVLIILLAAHDLNISSTLAIEKIYPIEGKTSMAAELMVALVIREGHEIWPEAVSDTKVVAVGRRKDSTRETRVEWTIEQAKRANLLHKDNWKKYPESMLWARAVSQLCRMRFADVLAGITYTPDELGAVTDADGNVIEAPGWEQPPTDPELDAETREEVRLRGQALPEDLRTEMLAKWKEWSKNGHLRPFAQLRESDRPRLDALFIEFEAKVPEGEDQSDIVDVEIVADGICVECKQDGSHTDECPLRPF